MISSEANLKVDLSERRPTEMGYTVDRLGNVYNKIGSKKPKPTNINKYGYEVVFLWEGNKSHSKTVHRLVAKAFIPNPRGKPCVNYKDGNKANNHVDNLEWVTYSENTLHAYQAGLKKAPVGEENPWTSLTDEKVRRICRLIELGHRTESITEEMQVSESIVTKIRSGASWKHISSQYSLKKSPPKLTMTPFIGYARRW